MIGFLGIAVPSSIVFGRDMCEIAMIILVLKSYTKYTRGVFFLKELTSFSPIHSRNRFMCLKMASRVFARRDVINRRCDSLIASDRALETVDYVSVTITSYVMYAIFEKCAI